MGLQPGQAETDAGWWSRTRPGRLDGDGRTGSTMIHAHGKEKNCWMDIDGTLQSCLITPATQAGRPAGDLTSLCGRHL